MKWEKGCIHINSGLFRVQEAQKIPTPKLNFSSLDLQKFTQKNHYFYTLGSHP